MKIIRNCSHLQEHIKSCKNSTNEPIKHTSDEPQRPEGMAQVWRTPGRSSHDSQWNEMYSHGLAKTILSIMS